ncbi:hypothetical protein LCGC14_0094490 [marine sediment metagenome]|uniref:FtsK domain-containing protein n=1 Tax=marine sediment metagenome TaxID=412755 RepID=A0A0F9YGK3_9ZZZZ|nr:DNA translocase FtsK [Phycisphaerae bacterium]HDZ45228.1 DNA translocase FtsK [Phycisphaerae bacterium]
MATKKKNHTSEDRQGDIGPARRYLRYGWVLAFCALVLLSWMSLLSYSPTDDGATWQYPPAKTQNAAGKVGALVAHTLRYWLGGGAYMGLLFATGAAVILVFGGRLDDMPWRMVGTLLLVVATSTAIYLRNPGGVTTVTQGAAGVLGHTIGSLLLDKFHVKGAWLIVCSIGLIGVMFTADKLVLSLPHAAKTAGGKLAHFAGQTPLLRRKAQLATGASGAVAGVKAASIARPAPAPAVAAAVPPATLTPPKTPAPPSPAKPPAVKEAPPAKSGQAVLPSIDLLADAETGYLQTQEALATQRRVVLQQTLNDFNVHAEVVAYQTGPVITLFELALSPGVKVSQVASLSTDIARALAVAGVRIVPHLAGRDTIGIEVPNDEKEIVRLKDLMTQAPDASQRQHLPLYLGKDGGGEPIIADLAAMPHLLIAGTTGSGKSVCINSIIMSLLLTRRPEDVRLILADPKMVEMAAFETLPHLLCPIVNDMRKAESILDWATIQMDERYTLLKEMGVRNIAGYNELTDAERHERLGVTENDEKARMPTRLAHYIIIIDELADLIMTSSKEVETYIIRIAQKARAVGIHLILATQRPSVNVVTGLIKSNMPCRISFQVASRQESRIVLDQNGAEVLLGRGDMLLLLPGSSNLIRAQGTYVDEAEIYRVVHQLKAAGGPEFNQELVQINSTRIDSDGGDGEKDGMFDKAVEVILTAQRGSVSLLQRRLQIGYGRASRIVDQMAEVGLLGEYKGSQARECLITLDDWQSLQTSIASDRSGASAADGQPTSV